MNDVLARRLISRAAVFLNRKYDREFIQETEQMMLMPKFNASTLNNWEYYVDSDLVTIWNTLDRSVQLAIYLTAIRAVHEIINIRAAADKH